LAERMHFRRILLNLTPFDAKILHSWRTYQ
jgi:hypothetical protein